MAAADPNHVVPRVGVETVNAWLDRMAATDPNYVVPCFRHDSQIPFALLIEMEDHPLSVGKSSWGTRNMLYALVLSLRPRRVLEIGTLIGSASVVMGIALKANGYGELICLEPQQHYFDAASEHIARAGLEGIVRVIRKFSYDKSLKDEIFRDTFDLIFIDAGHNYDAASFDINLSATHLSDNGFIVLDDVGAEASPKMDETGKGGVRQALIDFQRNRSNEFKTVFFEWPLWHNPMGMAILSKQRVSASEEQVSSDTQREIAPLRDEIASLQGDMSHMRTARIIELEAQFQRLANHWPNRLYHRVATSIPYRFVRRLLRRR